MQWFNCCLNAPISGSCSPELSLLDGTGFLAVTHSFHKYLLGAGHCPRVQASSYPPPWPPSFPCFFLPPSLGDSLPLPVPERRHSQSPLWPSALPLRTLCPGGDHHPRADGSQAHGSACQTPLSGCLPGSEGRDIRITPTGPRTVLEIANRLRFVFK